MGAIGKGVEGRLVDLDLLEMDVFSAGAETKSGKDRLQIAAEMVQTISGGIK
jgi:hypothetical protein